MGPGEELCGSGPDPDITSSVILGTSANLSVPWFAHPGTVIMPVAAWQAERACSGAVCTQCREPCLAPGNALSVRVSY